MFDKSNRYTTVFGDWQLGEYLGKGEETKVYQVSKNKGGVEDKSAVKLITIYDHPGRKENLAEEIRLQIEEEIQQRMIEASKEIKTMQKLCGNTNIVDLRDYDIREWQEEYSFGVDVLLRMELLQNLQRKRETGLKLSEQEIIRLGMDICEALILCHKENIIHRDIKPQNIFFNQNGNYKLGDFGISRIVDMARDDNMTRGKGTPAYIAPEQYREEKYDHRVDIYSLGLVLYDLANNNCIPFMGERQRGVRRRIKGEAFPPPSHVGEDLGQIIMKACAYRPEERYQTAQEFKNALLGLEMQGADVKEGYLQELMTRAEQGDTEAQNRIGVCYDCGNGVVQDYEEALKWFKKAAEKGDAQAYLNLGIYYADGHGVEINEKEAAKWYRLAAEQGNADAQNKLGVCIGDGKGVEQDYTEALHWFRKSAEQGNEWAYRNIGFYYEKGFGVEVDYEEAAEWYRKAVELGNEEAAERLKQIQY